MNEPRQNLIGLLGHRGGHSSNLLAIFIASAQFVDETDEAGASLNKANKLRLQKIAR